MYKQALVDLIAYCQNEGILSNTESVIEELSYILDYLSISEIEDLLY